MKGNYMRALICIVCTALLLSGCRALELLDQIQGESSASGTVSEQLGSSAASANLSKPKIGTPSASDDPAASGASDFLPVGAVGDIIRGAGPNDLMAVLQNPTSEVYHSLDSPAVELREPGDGIGGERALLVPLKEGVTITVEGVWLDYQLNFFFLTDRSGEFRGELGEYAVLEAYLADGIPHARIVAQWEDKYAVWYCQDNGMGAEDVVYISPEPIQPIDEFSNLNALSAAAATSAVILTEQPPGQMTPSQLAETPGSYWQTTAHALTLLQGDGFDLYGGADLEIPYWMMDTYTQALFPGIARPEFPETMTESLDNDLDVYVVEPCDYGDFASWEHIASETSADGKVGYVDIRVICPETIPDPVVYRVRWEANESMNIYSPFQHHMTGLKKTEEEK